MVPSAGLIRLTNAFGTDGAVVGGVTAGLRATGAALVTGTLRPATFGGARAVTVAAGADAVSDPVALPVAAGQDVAVSLYVRGPADAATRHGGAYTTSFSASDRDVVARTGVRTVILLEGSNDIGHDQGPVCGDPVTVADLIAGLTNIVQHAHADAVDLRRLQEAS
jgi:hypothetical protein